MKTFFSTLMTSIMLCAVLQAQTYNVTFQVDMNTQTSVPDTISVAGSFQEFTSVGAAWQAGATQMTDDNMDGVYEVTVGMTGAPDTIQYKFIYVLYIRSFREILFDLILISIKFI